MEVPTKRKWMALVFAGLAAIAGAVAVATPAAAKAPGPNGQIAFERFDPATGTFVPYIANADGTGAYQLPVPNTGEHFSPVGWAPDGSRLSVASLDGDIARPATVAPDGTGYNLLALSGLPPNSDVGNCRAWSPDGARLLCTVVNFGDQAEPNGLYTVRASDGGDPVRLTTSPSNTDDIAGDYSPDGTRVVFTRSQEALGNRGQSGALFVVNTDGTGLRQITPYGLPNSHDNGFASWSPDGSKIVFGSEKGHLYVVHPDGGGLREIHLEGNDDFLLEVTPGWSPNGQRIIFRARTKTDGDRGDIYTAKADGSDVVQVTDTPALPEQLPDWGTHPETP